MASITKAVNKDGTTRHVVRWREGRKSREAGFATERAARAYRAEIEGGQAKGVQTDVDAGRRTFGAYVADWRAAQVQHTAGTRRSVEGDVRLHMLPAFEHVQLRHITPLMVQRWVNEKAEQLAPSTFNRVWRWLRTVLRAGGVDTYKGVNVPLRSQADQQDETYVVLSHAQVATLAATIDAEYRAMVVLAARTGMRLGECLGLTWSRVDLENGTVEVMRQLSETTGMLEWPKTKTSRRTVYLDDATVAALRQHRKAYAPAAVYDNVVGRNVADAVFGFWAKGARKPVAMPKGQWSHVWAPASKAAGLPKHRGFHQLRHFAASVMIEQHVPLTDIRDQLGHSTLDELNRYGHSMGGRAANVRAAMAAAFGADNVAPLRKVG